MTHALCSALRRAALLLGLLAACAPAERRVSLGEGGAAASTPAPSSIATVDFDAPLGVVDRDARRTALVIGNGAYGALGRLDNPGSDARLMARTLADLGFEVQTGGALFDLTAAEMRAAVDDYRADLAARGGVGAVYFAGHAVQVEGRNWLAPVDAAPRDYADLREQFVAADALFQAGAAPGIDVNLVVLDACRDNPFASRGEGRSSPIQDPRLRGVSAGLSSVAAPPGTLIAFASAPGAVAFDGEGANSPYAEALARALREPGERIEDVFIRVRGLVAGATGGRQVPWETSSLTRQVMLSDPDAGPRRTARFDGTWVGALTCESMPGDWGRPPFARPGGQGMRFEVAGGVGVWSKGPPEPEPRWSGGVFHERMELTFREDGVARVRGTYQFTTEKSPSAPLRTDDGVSLQGRVAANRLAAQGVRGPRRCDLALSRL